MDQQYDKKRALLAKQTSLSSFEELPLLQTFWKRVCAPPFKCNAEPAQIWLQLWNDLGPQGRASLNGLPDPCLNHLEERMRKPSRAQHLTVGGDRLVRHDCALFVEGLRLFPHALCRACEVLGPVSDQLWLEIEQTLLTHRLWSVGSDLSLAAFWTAVERLSPYRELPQVILDYVESDRLREAAPVEEFQATLQRFLVRERIEKIRFETYAVLSGRTSSSLSLGGTRP